MECPLADGLRSRRRDGRHPDSILADVEKEEERGLHPISLFLPSRGQLRILDYCLVRRLTVPHRYLESAPDLDGTALLRGAYTRPVAWMETTASDQPPNNSSSRKLAMSFAPNRQRI